LLLAAGLRAEDLPAKVVEAEKKRIAAIQKAAPSVVAVITGGGSGVLISDDGLALTNFHVTSAAGTPFMKCGLSNGVLYDAVLVGLDKVGDVALIKLLAKKPGDKFPFAKMGDSDKLKAGDWSLAMGNPFMLATDFTPTVTFGLISGVHRYQYPAGTLLEYTDCIQIDTSINPGNSGGPLFNMDGELVGINGRGSFEKRGRVNSGVGYAISINQIKNFMGQLQAGLDSDHASLGALAESDSEEGPLGKLMVKGLIACDAQRRGLDFGDELVTFAGRPMNSVNQFKNVLGLYPRGWRMPMTYRRQSEKHEILVRLMGVQRKEIDGGANPDAPKPVPQPGIQPGKKPIDMKSPAAKFYEAKAGFVNFYFNKQERDRLLVAFKKHGDFSTVQGNWSIKGTGPIKDKQAFAQMAIKDKGAKDNKTDLVTGIIDGIDYSIEPLAVDQQPNAFKDPPGSGGLLIALFHYRQLLAFGEKGFVGDFSHGGQEPFYLPVGEKDKPDYTKQRVECEVLRTQHAGIPSKWYFALADDPARKILKGQLLGAEVLVDREEDPCEVYFSEYQQVDGRMLPSRLEVRHGDKTFAQLKNLTFKFEAAK